jgi:hypothetical protein
LKLHSNHHFSTSTNLFEHNSQSASVITSDQQQPSKHFYGWQSLVKPLPTKQADRPPPPPSAPAMTKVNQFFWHSPRPLHSHSPLNEDPHPSVLHLNEHGQEELSNNNVSNSSFVVGGAAFNHQWQVNDKDENDDVPVIKKPVV